MSDANEVRSVMNFDHTVVAVHSDAAKWLLPYVTNLDEFCQWVSQWILVEATGRSFPFQQLPSFRHVATMVFHRSIVAAERCLTSHHFLFAGPPAIQSLRRFSSLANALFPEHTVLTHKLSVKNPHHASYSKSRPLGRLKGPRNNEPRRLPSGNRTWILNITSLNRKSIIYKWLIFNKCPCLFTKRVSSSSSTFSPLEPPSCELPGAWISCWTWPWSFGRPKRQSSGAALWNPPTRRLASSGSDGVFWCSNLLMKLWVGLQRKKIPKLLLNGATKKKRQKLRKASNNSIGGSSHWVSWS